MGYFTVFVGVVEGVGGGILSRAGIVVCCKASK